MYFVTTSNLYVTFAIRVFRGIVMKSNSASWIMKGRWHQILVPGHYLKIYIFQLKVIDPEV